MAHVCNYTATEIDALAFTDFLMLSVGAEKWLEAKAKSGGLGGL